MSTQEAVLKITVDVDGEVDKVKKLEKELRNLKDTAQKVKTSTSSSGGGSNASKKKESSGLDIAGKMITGFKGGIGSGISGALGMLGPMGKVAGGVVDMLGKGLSLIGNIVTAFVSGLGKMAKAVGGFVVDSVKSYAETSDIRQTANVVMKKNLAGGDQKKADAMETELFDRLQGLAMETGQSVTDMYQGGLDAINRMGAKSVDEAYDIVKLANDMSAKTGRSRSTSQMLSALVSSSTGKNAQLVNSGVIPASALIGMSKDGKTLSGQKGAGLDDILKWLKDPNNGVSGMAKETFGSFKDLGTALGNTMEAFKIAFGEKISKLIIPDEGGGILNTIHEGFGQFAKNLSGINLDAWKPVIANLNLMVSEFFDWINGMDWQSTSDWLAGIFTDLTDRILPLWHDALDGISNSLIPKLGDTMDKVKEIGDNVLEFFNDFHVVTDVAEKLGKTLDAVNGIITKFQGTGNPDDGYNKAGRWLESVLGIDMGGGDVGGNPNPHPANLFPQVGGSGTGSSSNNNNSGGKVDLFPNVLGGTKSTGGHTINVHVNGAGDPEHVAKKVVEHINKNLKTVGGL